MKKIPKFYIKAVFYVFIFVEIIWQILKYQSIVLEFLPLNGFKKQENREISLDFNYLILKLNKKCEFSFKKIFYFKIENCYQYSPGETIKISTTYDSFANEQYIQKRLIVKDVKVVREKNIFSVWSKKILGNLFQFCENLRVFFLNFINTNFNRKSQPLFISLVLGKKSLSRLQRRDELLGKISNIGLAHLIAISGYHIGVLVDFLKKILFSLGKKTQGLIIISLLFFYLILLGEIPSLMRAIFMIFVSILARTYLGRQYNSLKSLLNVFLLLLSFNIFYIFDLGFQLSFLATLGIILYFRLFKKENLEKEKIILNYKIRKKTIVGFFIDNVKFLFFLNLFIFPLLIKSFNEFNFLNFFISLPLTFFFVILIKYSYFLVFFLVINLGIRPFSFKIFTNVYDKLVWVVEYFVNYCDRINFFKIEISYFDYRTVILWYLFLLFLVSKIKPKYEKNMLYYYLG
jgi:competence protein ComEC